MGERAVQVVVVNHNQTRGAELLLRGFAPHAATLAIDSGSDLTPSDEALFEVRLPNVYYGGLFNAAVEACAALAEDDVMLLVCSDVRVENPLGLITRLHAAFADPRVGVYGPSATGAGFTFIAPRGTGGLRAVPFVEGFCVATRLGIARALAPIDTRLNAIGWGIDVYLAVLALTQRMRSVIDDGITVHHPRGSGYAWDAASEQMRRWMLRAPRLHRWMHRWLLHDFAETRVGDPIARAAATAIAQLEVALR